MRFAIHGARCAMGSDEIVEASIEVDAGRITRIGREAAGLQAGDSGCARIDLGGFLLMPGLINAHDHLQFGLFPRLANPPYQNYIEWGDDIHSVFQEEIARHKAVPKDVRLWWGGIRNLLCGVTTVCQHDPLWPELRRDDFPVRVLQHCGWAHSPTLGGDLHAARAATPAGCPFILHACEGTDHTARMELWKLDRMGLLDADTILVHALAIEPEGAALLRRRGTSVILCPSSNQFLFGITPPVSLLSSLNNLALGNDSPLTAVGDLLDEVRFAIHACVISPRAAYRMITEAPAAILRLEDGEGSIAESGTADLIAVRDRGGTPAKILQTLSAEDVEFVMIRGRVQLASEAVVERLPDSVEAGLEPLSIDGSTRWLRAPICDLLEQAEAVLGQGNVRLSDRSLCIPETAAAPYA